MKFKENRKLYLSWDGNPIKELLLDMDVFHIAVNEKDKKMFAVVKNEEGGFNIICYVL